MHRSIIALCLLGLSGCGATGDRNVAARVADHELSTDRLTELLVAWEGRPIEIDFVDQFVRHWIHVNLFAERMAAGDSLLDSARVLYAMWPDVLEFLAADLVDRVFDEAFPLETARIDSVYEAGELRVLWYKLHRSPAEESPADRARQRAAALEHRAQLARGNTWDQLITRGDNGLALLRQGGSLDLLKPGQTVPAFDSVAFGLAPGELARVVESEFGFHVLYRPSLEEIRPEFELWVKRDLFQTFDSAYGERLIDGGGFELEVDPEVLREIAEFPVRHLDGDRLLATYRNGRITSGTLVRWLQYLPVDMNRELSEGSDENAVAILRDVAKREMLRDQVDSAGLQLADSVYTWLEERYRETVFGLWNALDLNPTELAGQGEPLDVRRRIARVRLNTYLDRVTSGEHGLARVHPFLAASLRSDGDWDLNRRAVDRAMDQAARRRETAGS